jgi:anti-sigma regulatory factor (Ser/Thr protein kinase)
MDEATLSPCGRGASTLSFDGDGLHNLRSLVAQGAAAAGAAEDRVLDFVLAASEVGANSVAHGGGRGTARLWRRPGALVLEVHDQGRFSRLAVPATRPDPSQERGRGLWIADQLCDSVQIRSGADGTFVRLQMLLV